MAVLALVSVVAFLPPLLVLYLPDGLFSRHPHRFAEMINRWWAVISTWPLLRVSVTGLERLGRPGQGEQDASNALDLARPPSRVYVCNHSSALDIFIALRALPGFKFISKSSVFLIPFVGWAMFLTGHVRLRRTDRKSQVACLKECARLLRRGSSLLLFPEGTRSRDGRLQPYKKGAFSLAAKAGCPVVPVTIRGASSLLPRNAPWLFFPGVVDVMVHDPIPPGDPEKMAEQAWKATHAALVGEGGA
ncbi:hypothetical protein H632_c481p1 [Helicosporidium sp. ATCC 50920]|nr:hypothetical protein H632_c481p1 [Helicosporidium sp. ATCC 50920]|eukprot:KDD75828.1 hypothetical protein H632_c481p1 [Helicosporidium sp. ATCC 50920]